MKFNIRALIGSYLTKTKYNADRLILNGWHYAIKIKKFKIFDSAILGKLKYDLGLALSIEELKAVQSFFTEIQINPTPAEIKIIDRIWNENSFYFDREIGEVKIDDNSNPHIAHAFRLYKSLRSTHSKEPLSLRELSGIRGIAGLTRDVSTFRRKKALSVSAYKEDKHEDFFVKVSTTLLSDKKQFRAIDYLGFKPLQVIFKQFERGKHTPMPLNVGENIFNASTYTFKSEISSNIKEEFTSITTVSAIPKAEMLQNFDENGNILFWAKKKNPENEIDLIKMLTANFSTTKFSGCSRGVIVSALKLTDGIDLELSALMENGSHIADVLSDTYKDGYIFLVHPNQIQSVNALAASCGFECKKIGETNDQSSLRIMAEGAYIVDLPYYFLINYRPESAVYIDDPICQSDFATVRGKSYKRLIAAVVEEGIKTPILDYTGADGAVYLPDGGKMALTPPTACGNLLKSDKIYATALLTANGAVSRNNIESDFIAAIYSEIVAVSKLVCTGVSPQSLALSVALLMPPTESKGATGKIMSGLLGVLYMQNAMSLDCLNLDELVLGVEKPIYSTVAIGTGNIDRLITNVFCKGQKLFHLPIKRDAYNVPDFRYLLKLYNIININIEMGNIEAAATVENDIASTLSESLVGNKCGISIASLRSSKPCYGDIIIAIKDVDKLGKTVECDYLGVVDEGDVRGADFCVGYDEIFKITGLTRGVDGDSASSVQCYLPASKSTLTVSHPEVIIPNIGNASNKLCERFVSVGAKLSDFHFDLSGSGGMDKAVRDFRSALQRAQILALPEKLTTEFKQLLRSPVICDAINEMQIKRDCLILGINDGADILFELGYVPYGKSCDTTKIKTGRILKAESDAIRTVKYRLEENGMPWALCGKTGETYAVPIDMRYPYIEIENKEIVLLPYQIVNYGGYAGKEDIKNRPTLTVFSQDGKIMGTVGLFDRTTSTINGAPIQNHYLFESAIKYFS